MKTKWIDEGWYSDVHDCHVFRCSFCEERIVKRPDTEPLFCPYCKKDMREDAEHE